MTREQRLAGAFVELADTLVVDFDLIDFLHTLIDHSIELLHAEAAGLMVADQRGQLKVIASSSESAAWSRSSSFSTLKAPVTTVSRPANLS